MTTREKECYCCTCDKDFHYLGIATHRAMHRNKKEDCTIIYTYGNKVSYKFSEELSDAERGTGGFGSTGVR